MHHCLELYYLQKQIIIIICEMIERQSLNLILLKFCFGMFFTRLFIHYLLYVRAIGVEVELCRRNVSPKGDVFLNKSTICSVAVRMVRWMWMGLSDIICKRYD